MSRQFPSFHRVIIHFLGSAIIISERELKWLPCWSLLEMCMILWENTFRLASKFFLKFKKNVNSSDFKSKSTLKKFQRRFKDFATIPENMSLWTFASLITIYWERETQMNIGVLYINTVLFNDVVLSENIIAVVEGKKKKKKELQCKLYFLCMSLQ